MSRIKKIVRNYGYNRKFRKKLSLKSRSDWQTSKGKKTWK